MHGGMAFNEADLNGYADGRIEPSRSAALAASLGADPEAAARLDAWRRQTDSLRGMFASVLSEPVPVRLLPARGAMLAGGAVPTGSAMPASGALPARGGPVARRPDGPRVAGVVATTAFGAALVGFALGALACLGTDGFGLAPAGVRGGVGQPAALPAPQSGAPAEGHDLAAWAAEAHRAFLSDPSTPTVADASRLSHAIGRRVGAGLRVPDLARLGWTFQGGHTVPGPRGPAAVLTYADGTGRLGLTVSRGDGGAPRLVAADDEVSRLGVATWGDGEYGYALATDRGRDWLARNLAPLRDRVRAQVRAGGEDGPPP